ncbi:MAG: ferritin-like domain-containing protein [Actinomycetota bacterium]|nr:ferritin-like domain-containing protein [Actinomycetota bacterium]
MERLGGFLPPTLGIRKRIRGDRGETRVGTLPGWPFRVTRRGGRVSLVYHPPFSAIVDELWVGAEGPWLGRSTFGGRELGRFRMLRGEYNDTRSEEGEGMIQEQRLRRKLVEYVQNVHAMEQNVLLMLDSMILTTRDPEIVSMLRQHKEETRRQEQRLSERRKALGGLGLASVGKDLAAIAAAQAKGVTDLWRADKAIQNARDAFVTEHLEIAAYELLERLAERAGDRETAEVARENRAEEEAMAQRIASNWDRFLDLTLAEQGIRA